MPRPSKRTNGATVPPVAAPESGTADDLTVAQVLEIRLACDRLLQAAGAQWGPQFAYWLSQVKHQTAAVEAAVLVAMSSDGHDGMLRNREQRRISLITSKARRDDTGQLVQENGRYLFDDPANAEAEIEKKLTDEFPNFDDVKQKRESNYITLSQTPAGVSLRKRKLDWFPTSYPPSLPEGANILHVFFPLILAPVD